jgi:hypothetical protein
MLGKWRGIEVWSGDLATSCETQGKRRPHWYVRRKLMSAPWLQITDWKVTPCCNTWNRPLSRKKKTGFCACAITFVNSFVLTVHTRVYFGFVYVLLWDFQDNFDVLSVVNQQICSGMCCCVVWYESVETTNKIQRCNRIYNSKIYWRLNMFREAYRSPSGVPNSICSLWFMHPCGDRPLSRLGGNCSHYTHMGV